MTTLTEAARTTTEAARNDYRTARKISGLDHPRFRALVVAELQFGWPDLSEAAPCDWANAASTVAWEWNRDGMADHCYPRRSPARAARWA